MSRAGQTIENKVTGERAVIITGTEETNGKLIVVDLFLKPGAAVAGEHIHPNIEERFTVLKGKVAFRLNGVDQIAPLNETLIIRPGVVHDWWNTGDEEAHVRVEVTPGARFEQAILNLFGLANDGKTNTKGMPHPLQLAVLGKEFQDVLLFTSPPIPVQKIVFTLLAPIARLMGYHGSYAKYNRMLG